MAGRELRDLWLGGRALTLLFALAVLLSVLTYLAATNSALNLLEHRESVSLVQQVAIGVGVLLVLLVSADAVSGERERGTLEGLLLTPAPRMELTLGKLVAALSLWVGSMAVALPYLWFLGTGPAIVGRALGAAALAGTLLAVAFAGLGVLVSVLSGSNRLSLSVGLFVLIALFVPTQLPLGATQGWLGDLLLRLNPVTAALHWTDAVVVKEHAWTAGSSWLVSPLVAAVVLGGAALLVGGRSLRLRAGLVGATALALLFAAGPAPARAAGSVAVRVEPAHVAQAIGAPFPVTATVQNRGTTSVRLSAHLDVVDPARRVYVDPEDWNSDRTVELPALAPGRTARHTWTVKPVSGGDFAIYVVVLGRDAASGRLEQVESSPALSLHVSERRSLDPGGALPLVIAVPGGVGMLALGTQARRRRRRPRRRG